MIAAIKKSMLFKGMSELELNDILEKYPHRIKSYSSKETIFFQNDTCDKLYMLVEGLVEAHMVDSMGKLIVVGELSPGSLLAPAFLFTDINKFPVAAIAAEESKVLYFNRDTVLSMFQEYPVMHHNFLRIISNRSVFLSKKVKIHALMPLKNKIANYIIQEFENQGVLQITIPHTQQELADRFGVARPSFARTLSELEKDGLINVEGRQLNILNLWALKRISE